MSESERKTEYARKTSTSLYESGEVGRLHKSADRLASAGNFAGAVDAYSRLLESKKIYEAYTNRGVCYTRLGKYDRALADFTAALELEPQHTHRYINHNNKGYAYHNKGQHEWALGELNTALGLNPAYADAHYNKAETCREMSCLPTRRWDRFDGHRT